MMNSIVQYQNRIKLSFIVLPIIIITVVLASCIAGSPSPATSELSPEYIEKHFIVPGNEVIRYNIFAEKENIISGTWKSDKSVYMWYTDTLGRAKPLKDYGTGPNGERVLDVREPGLNEHPSLRVGDSQGNYLYDDPMDGSRGGDFEIKASRQGYYSLCFMLGSANQDTSVVLRYRVQ